MQFKFIRNATILGKNYWAGNIYEISLKVFEQIKNPNIGFVVKSEEDGLSESEKIEIESENLKVENENKEQNVKRNRRKK